MSQKHQTRVAKSALDCTAIFFAHVPCDDVSRARTITAARVAMVDSQNASALALHVAFLRKCDLSRGYNDLMEPSLSNSKHGENTRTVVIGMLLSMFPRVAQMERCNSMDVTRSENRVSSVGVYSGFLWRTCAMTRHTAHS